MGKVLPLYYEGALLTLRVGAIGILLALAVGMVTAVARYWRIPILNTAAVIYTEFSRNTPLLVQLFFLYFGLPKVGIRISGEWCAIIGLAFIGGSYMAEALRAGLESVSTVQTESARVLGLTPFQTMMLAHTKSLNSTSAKLIWTKSKTATSSISQAWSQETQPSPPMLTVKSIVLMNSIALRFTRRVKKMKLISLPIGS